MSVIEPTIEDVNQVFKDNPQAAQQLQIVSQNRMISELEQRIVELESQLDTESNDSKNGKGSAKELEKIK